MMRLAPEQLLDLPAPAKLNLFLRITGRRADGYHNLQTLFQMLDYGDRLDFRLRRDGAVNLQPELTAIPEKDNLVNRAARSLQTATGCLLGADIRLDKRLPRGGGVGGGSSDAATTLLALNRLWQLNLSLAELAAIGLELGADIPVFVHGHSAWAEGVGEQLSPIDLEPNWFLVVAPNCQVSTAQVFAHEQLTRHSVPITIRAFREQGSGNDCQPVVEDLYPGVKKARMWLDKYAPAQMTGTGACLFARFETELAARAVLRQIPAAWQGFVARGVNRSPVHELLAL